MEKEKNIEKPRIDINEIVIKDNVRIDYRRPPSFLASMKECGIRKPIEIKKDKELTDGHVRVHWCKIAIKQLIQEGKKEKADEIRKIRFYYDDERLDKTISQLIYGTSGKNINPIEEGKSYKKEIEKKKISEETLAKKLFKPVTYVKKRLILADLPEEIQKVLIDEKIQMGHALALARLSSEKEMKEKLKEIINDKLSVAGTIDILKNYNTDLDKAQFDKTECKTCKFNGSQQGQLFETGTTLKGNCLNEKCFFKKTREYFAQLKKEYKEKGIRILTDEEYEKLKHYTDFSSYNMPVNNLYKKKCKKGCEKFAVCFHRNYSDEIEIKEICLNPRCFQGITKTDENPKEKTKRLTQQTTNRLQGNVSLYKRNFLINKATELIKPSTKQTKAFILHTLLAKYDTNQNNEVIEKILKEIGLKDRYNDDVFLNIMKLEETKIDELIAQNTSLHLSEVYNLTELSKVSESFGVSLEKHFVITKEFLKPYTKTKLIELAKEIGLHNYLIEKGKADWIKGKRPEMVDCFFKEGFDLKGKVPKIMLNNKM